MTEDAEGTESLSARRFFLAWAEVAGLWSLSIAWPIYQRLPGGPESLTGVGVRRLDLVVFVILVSLLVPLVLVLAEFAVAKVSGRVTLQRVIQGVLCASLAALWIWQQLDSQPGVLQVVVPLVVFSLFAAGYVRTEFTRNFTALLALATPVVIVLFALSYPVKDAILPGEKSLAAQSTDSETPVVIVVLDELPTASLVTDDRQIDRQFFPEIAALSKESTWYRRALSIADNTLSAVPAMLSGEEPTLGSLSTKRTPPGRPQYPDTVCSTAERAGYELYSHELVTDFCGRSYGLGTRLFALLKQGLPAKPPDFLPDSLKPDNPDQLTPGWVLESAVDSAAELFPPAEENFSFGRDRTFREFIDNLPDGGRSMSVLHIALPHVEYQYLPDGGIYGNRDLADAATAAAMANPEVPRESAKNLQQMTSQMIFTDRLVGELIDHMKKAGTWDDSLFVLTADHGVSFRSGSARRDLDRRNAGWLMPVPLFIKYPNQEKGELVDADVDSRDIEPTVLGEIGLEPSPRSTGRDLATAPLEPRPEVTGISSSLGPVTLPRKKVDAEENQAIRWRNRVFSSRRLNAIGGHGDLIGKAAAGVPGLRRLRFEPIQGSVYDDVQPDQPVFGHKLIPVYFQATLPGVKSDPGPLAVTLNGEVAATTRAWKRDGTWVTAVNLSEDAFRQGKNPTGVYAIGGG